MVLKKSICSQSPPVDAKPARDTVKFHIPIYKKLGGNHMAFFKSGDELVSQGNDLVKRKEFDKARKSFQKAIDKKTKDRDLCEVMIALLSLTGGNLSNPGAYQSVAQILRQKGDMDFEFGLTEVNAQKLAEEAEILAEEFSNVGIPRNGANFATRGKKLIETGMKYQTKIGNDVLVIPETLSGVSMTGQRRALKLMAEGNEDLAESVVFQDPRKAAEYQQIAMNFRIQMGESGDANRQKIEGYSKSCSCWFCGRDVTGQNIHFFPMSSDVGVMQYKERDESHLDVKSPQGDAIYACRACYSAISRRADSIANHYHRQAMSEIARVESSLRAEIASVRSQVNSISYNR